MRATTLAIVLLLLASPAIAAPPDEALRRKAAGNQFLKYRQYEAARGQYLAALKLAPDYADVHYNLGVLYFFRLGDNPRALYHLVRYGSLVPDASDLDQVRALASQALEKIEESDRDAYAEALRAGTVAALEGFRESHRLSPYTEDAESKIRLLQEYEREARRREQATQTAYERALSRASPEAMDQFLRSHPNAPQAAEARRLHRLWAERRAKDERAFLVAVDAGSTAALAAFLDENPRSDFAPEAQKLLLQLQASEEAYLIAAESRSVPALERFLTSYGDSAQAESARQLLDELRAEREHTARAAAAASALAAADEAWQIAEAVGSVAAYQDFLEHHPDHPRAAEAKARVAALEERAEADRVWETVEGEGSAEAYRDFSVAYPEHPRAGDADRRATQLEEAAVAERAWNSASEEGTSAAYRSFLASHPEHIRADEARRRISELEQEEAAKLERQRRDQAWDAASRADTPEAYSAFVAAHPNHPAAEKARRRGAQLTQEAAATGSRLAADRAWASAEAADSVDVYLNFYRHHSDHPRAEEARRRAAAMAAAAEAAPVASPAPRAEQPRDPPPEAIRQESEPLLHAEPWERARKADTVESYEEFLSKYPDAEEGETARARLSELRGTSPDSNLSRSRRRALDRYRRLLIGD